MRLSKIEKYYISGHVGVITENEITKDLGRSYPDTSVSRYIKTIEKDKALETPVQTTKPSSTFNMFGNTKKGSVISNKGASEIGDASRKKNEKELPPYVRRI